MSWEVLFITFLILVKYANNFPVSNKIIQLTKVENLMKYRLPENLKPTHYDITLEPNLDRETLTGTVIIDVKVVNATKSIVLHRNGIEFDQNDVSVTNNGKKIEVTKLGYDPETHFCTITLGSALAQNDLTEVTIEFFGRLARTNMGFYIGEFKTDVGVWKFATTQLGPVSAREVFPCFDEPHMKAKFTTHLIRGAGYKSLSNMPQSGTSTLGPGRIQDNYHTTTAVMSTYLVAFVVSTFEKVRSGIYSIYAVKHLIKDNRGKYALDSSIQIIKNMEKFVGIDYILPKLDQVAIPDEYFDSGAMENWGLVLYKQKYLLYKKGISTVYEQQSTLSIIAHELSHQWFGNLVTHKWWNSLWLTEGFATYFEYYITNQVDPNMKMMDQYIILVNQRALDMDSLPNTRPMNAAVGVPGDIPKLLDVIAYQKGKSGAVIRMLEHIVSFDVFRGALKNYLTNLNQKSAEPADLWKAFQDTVDKLSRGDKASLNLDKLTIAEIMEPWNANTGYPLVTAKRDSRGLIMLSQERFSYKTKGQHYIDTLWTIPINYAEEDAPSFTETRAQFWLRTKQEVTYMKVNPQKWFIVNKQETFFYRVNYDLNTWNLIIHAMNSNFANIHVLNRAQLLDDSLHLARYGRLSYLIPLRLSQYLTKETEYVPLKAFLECMYEINHYMSSSDQYQLFKNYINSLLRTKFKDLTITDKDTHVDKLKRADVIEWLCKFKDKVCMDAMHKALISVEAAKPDLQTSVYCGGMRLTDNVKKKFEKLYTIYRNTNDSDSFHKRRALQGMGCSYDKTFSRQLLTSAIGQGSRYDIKTEDRKAAFYAVCSSSDFGMDQAVTFLVDRFKDVKEAFKEDEIAGILGGCVAWSSSKKHAEKLGSINDEEYIYILDIVKNRINLNNKYSEEKLGDLKVWLSDNYSGVGLPSLSVSLKFSVWLLLMLVYM